MSSRQIDTERRSICGRILDEEGREVPQCNVTLERLGACSVTSTNAAGQFAFRELSPARYAVSARLGARYCQPMAIGRSAFLHERVLWLRLGATLVVRVLGGRRPVTTAVLTVNGRDVAPADAFGICRVDGLGPGTYECVVRASGWSPYRMLQVVHVDGFSVIELCVSLERGAPVNGCVLDQHQQPLAGRTLTLRDVQGGWLLNTTTDERGRWQIGELKPGSFAIYETRETATSIRCDGRTPLDDVRILVPRSVEVSGRVIGDDGSAVANARVELRGPSEYSVSTDDDGTFCVLAPDAGLYVVVAYTWQLSSASASVEVPPDGTAFVRLTLAPGVLAGVATGEDGRPAAEISILATHDVSRYSVVTSREGAFDLGVLPRGEYRLNAYWRCSAPRRSSNGVRVLAGDETVSLLVESWGTLTGTVSHQGKPMVEFWVGASSSDTRTSLPIIAVSNSYGVFTIPNMNVGNWSIAIVAENICPLHIDSIHIVASENKDLGVLSVVEGVRVHGGVYDTAGVAVHNARVIINSGYEGWSRVEAWLVRSYEAWTDENGQFSFASVDVNHGSPLRIRASHESLGDSFIQELSPASVDLRLVLLRTGEMQGLLIGHEGSYVAVAANVPQEPVCSRMAPVAVDGTFYFKSLPVGQYFVSLILSRPVSPLEVFVETDQIAQVKLAMPKDLVRVVLRIANLDCADALLAPVVDGVPDAERAIKPSSVMRYREERRFAFARVLAGDYAVSVDRGSWRPITIQALPKEQIVALLEV